MFNLSGLLLLNDLTDRGTHSIVRLSLLMSQKTEAINGLTATSHISDELAD